jgi:hypothetical protein
MTYSEIADILDADIVQTALVTRPKGSWKWQDAFAVSCYRWSVNADETRGIWRHVSTGNKMSEPQLRARGIECDGTGRPTAPPTAKATA